MQAPLKVIAAVDYGGGFARGGQIPWYFKEDFQHFQKTTKGHVCVMGRKTYEDMLRIALEREDARIQQIISKEKERCKEWGIEYTPSTTENIPRTNIPLILPNRQSYVLTRNPNATFAGASAITSLRSLVEVAPNNKNIFIIGGERLFHEGIVWSDTVHLTVVKEHYNCDKFFPIKYLEKKFRIIRGHETDKLLFMEYHRIA